MQVGENVTSDNGATRKYSGKGFHRTIAVAGTSRCDVKRFPKIVIAVAVAS